MEIEMKKFAFICAAVVTLAVPSVVSAQGVSVHVGDDGYYRDRGEIADTIASIEVPVQSTTAIMTVAGIAAGNIAAIA
jgi:hypothetical protein